MASIQPASFMEDIWNAPNVTDPEGDIENYQCVQHLSTRLHTKLSIDSWKRQR